MYVYKLTRPDKSEYIGSCANLKKRLREHKSIAKTNPEYQKVSSVISKVGFENVKIEVLAILETRALAYEFEQTAIKIAESYGVHLLNADLSKRRKGIKKNVCKKRMSEMANIAWANPKTRKYLSLLAKRRALANPEEMRRRHALSVQSKIIKRPLIKVYSKSGDFLVETRSTKKLEAILKVNQASICRYIRKERTPRNFILEVLS